ncbi:hypothetical protein GCM10027422_44550 [Hymenobacter arcticus]
MLVKTSSKLISPISLIDSGSKVRTEQMLLSKSMTNSILNGPSINLQMQELDLVISELLILFIQLSSTITTKSFHEFSGNSTLFNKK